ncbi:MAG: beta-ketoacyl-[acyl-carrier-protein] synthase family protein [Lachnospiraceae bacterium]|nr:beta-ketoacyl-[acyl-carrier-protein] synthase family protein [Lachnospiraceae bacterium]
MADNEKRCVITGLGMINAIGNTVDESWNNCINGVSGIKEVRSIDTSDCYAHLGAESAEHFDVEAGDDEQKMDRVSLLCVKAANEAIKDSGIIIDDSNADRVGVIMGSCVGGAVSIQKFFTDRHNAEGSEDTSDIIKMPIGVIANNVAKIAGAKGVVTNVGNACAASTISIEYACDLIRAGVGDAFIVGGADSFSALAFGGFTALHALDTDPCSPYNKSKGITLGEGAGALIVESYEHAVARNAKIYCDVLGGGISSDAHHITAPRPDSEGQMNAMKWALSNSDLKPSDIDYINGHATGTPLNDSTEIQAMQTIFGDNDNTAVDSTKSMVGHCLGAAGAVEAIYTVKALTTDTVPPTIGYSDEDLENLKEKAGKLDFMPNVSKHKEIDYAMTNNFAFGGNNASVIFAKNEKNIKPLENNKVYVTGFGIVSPAGNTVDSYVEAVKNGGLKSEGDGLFATVGADDYKEYGIKLNFYRKLDKLSQTQVVSGRACLADAGVTVTTDNETEIGMIVGTADGPATEIINFHEGLIKNGLHAGSAFIFPNTVYNAAGGYFSINSGVKGVNVTLTNGMQAGLQSICYAYNVVRDGAEKMMMATGLDENTETMKLLYGKLGYFSNDEAVKPYELNGSEFVLGEGSTTMMLESEASADARNAVKYAEIAGYAMTHESVSAGTLAGSDAALDKAIIKACENAGISVDDIDAIVGFGDGNKTVDAIEMNSYGRVFKNVKPVMSVKTVVGESRAAAANLEAVHAALTLSGKLPSKQDAYVFENGKAVKTTVDTTDYKYMLVTSFAAGGSYTAVVLKKVD